MARTCNGEANGVLKGAFCAGVCSGVSAATVPVRIVKLNTAGELIPATAAVTWKLPGTSRAISAGVVAIPAESVNTLMLLRPVLILAAVGLIGGAAKVTIAPDAGRPVASITRAFSGLGNSVEAGADWADPEITVI